MGPADEHYKKRLLEKPNDTTTTARHTARRGLTTPAKLLESFVILGAIVCTCGPNSGFGVDVQRCWKANE
jgi:hypothetical protein